MRVLFNKIVTLGSIYSTCAISQNVFSIFPLRPKAHGIFLEVFSVLAQS